LKNHILEIFRESIRVKEEFIHTNLDVLSRAIETIAHALGRGNKILFFGNGGSAADAQHIAAEFVNRYIIDRPPLAAIALTTDSSVLTSIANDFEYDQIFEKQIRALGKRDDVAVGISTSGKSRNVTRGLRVAREIGLVTIGIGGPPNSPMEYECTYYIPVHGGSTPRIQEVHIILGHVIVELSDRMLYGDLEGSLIQSVSAAVEFDS